jgi:hypothetical protein
MKEACPERATAGSESKGVPNGTGSGHQLLGPVEDQVDLLDLGVDVGVLDECEPLTIGHRDEPGAAKQLQRTQLPGIRDQNLGLRDTQWVEALHAYPQKLSADNERFLLVVEQGGTWNLAVVTNWTAELEGS